MNAVSATNYNSDNNSLLFNRIIPEEYKKHK
jgi:hypothetical protein